MNKENETADIFTAVKSKVTTMTIVEAKGLAVTQNVRDDNGYLVAAVGQIVTDGVIERIRAAGKEAELMAAVKLTPQEAVQGRIGVMAEGIQQVAEDALDAVREKVSDVAEQLTPEQNDADDTTTVIDWFDDSENHSRPEVALRQTS